MRLIREFEFAMHEEYGNIGLRPTWIPNTDPFLGMAVAHDILEHMPGDKGTFEDEMQALGASLWIRSNGYYQRNGNINPVHVHIGSEFENQKDYFSQRGDGICISDPGRTLALDEWVENDITEALKYGRKCERDRCRENEGYGDDTITLMTSRNMRYIHGWMRKGYRRTVRRYKGIQSYQVEHMFITIEEKADLLIKHAEIEGAKVKFIVDVDRGDVRTVMQEYGDDDY